MLAAVRFQVEGAMDSSVEMVVHCIAVSARN